VFTGEPPTAEEGPAHPLHHWLQLPSPIRTHGAYRVEGSISSCWMRQSNVCVCPRRQQNKIQMHRGFLFSGTYVNSWHTGAKNTLRVMPFAATADCAM